MTTGSDQVVKVGGREFIRVPLHATARLVENNRLPEQVVADYRAIASKLHAQDANSPDLVWVQFILDTEGGNKNWDYNPRPAIAKFYDTAIFKPLDMEHLVEEKASMVGTFGNPPVKNTIYGVMSHAKLSWSDGTLLTDDEISKLDLTDDPSRKDGEKLCVTAWAAMYAYLFPETVGDVCERIKAGQMSVSMERWIEDFDFLVMDQATGQYKPVTKADASNNGVFSRWASRQSIANSPVWRRSLAYCYGGVASTMTPANPACKFQPLVTKAAASEIDQQILDLLIKRHDEVELEFAVASREDQNRLIAEHARITRMYGELTGQLSGGAS